MQNGVDRRRDISVQRSLSELFFLQSLAEVLQKTCKSKNFALLALSVCQCFKYFSENLVGVTLSALLMEKCRFAGLTAQRHEKGLALRSFPGVVGSKAYCERRISLGMRQQQTSFTQISLCRVLPAACWLQCYGRDKETNTDVHTCRQSMW